MNKLVLNLERGVGTLSGQGEEPVVMLSFSDDGGKTFTTEMWAKIGRLGEFDFGVEWNCLGSFFQRIIRVRMTDPVSYTIISAAIDVEVGV